MRVGNAPIKDNITDVQASPAWQQWFGAVGTAISGEWSTRSIGTDGKCCICGGMMVVSFDWTAYPSGSLTLPAQVESGLLQFFDGNGSFLTASLVSGSTIAVPSSSHTGRTLAVGSFVVKR